MREMKDSGISWVGEIPKIWDKRPIRSVIKSRIGGVWGNDVNDDNQGVICIRIADFDFLQMRIKNVDTEMLTYRLYNPIQIKKYTLQKNDILIEKSGGGEKTPVGRAVLFDKTYTALFANFMDRIRVNDAIVLPAFFEYWLWNLYSCRVTPYYINQTIGIQNIDLTFMLAKEKICFPSLNEQQRIAEFLDRECGKIDGLKADIQAQIDTLEQYKRSIITEAVTHGLNPSAPMKDSAISRVGDIPQNWKIKRLKYLFKFCKGLPITKDNLIGQGLPVISYGQIHAKTNNGVDVRPHLLRFVDFSYQTFYPLSQVMRGDFVFADTSEDYEGCGNCVYKRNDSLLFAGYHTIIAHSIVESDNRFFAYLFQTDIWRQQIREKVSGVKVFSITQKTLSNTYLILPPLDEQQEIADYLDNKCAEIEQIIADKKSQIETLDGYKKSLIFEYVTGKEEVV